MSETVFVVESPARILSQWESPELGLAAELAALGQAGMAEDVEVRCITHPEDLFELAHAIATDESLPGRALVFAGVDPASKLGRDHVDGSLAHGRIEEPPDYDEMTDPHWAWRGDSGHPLAPYGRLIAARLVRKAVPDVRFNPRGDEDDAFVAGDGFFHYAYEPGTGGSDVLQPSYNAFLRAVNHNAVATGAPYMAIVDALGQPTHDGRTAVIDGADIDARYARHSDLAERTPEQMRWRQNWERIHYIGATARVLARLEPVASEQDTQLVIPRTA